MSFASIKAAFVRVLGLGEAEAHQFVEAAIADLHPLLADVETKGKALLNEGFGDVKTELAALRADVTAILTHLGPAQTPPVAVEPPAAPTAAS